MSVHLSAASCIDWAARLTGSDVPSFFALAEATGADKGSELFLPYLSGERTPHNDAHVRGAFLGLDNETDPGKLAQAVLEGVAFAHAGGLDALREAGTHIEELAVIGGGSRSLYWGRIIAAALGVRLAYLEGGEVGPALGAARLAQMAITGAKAADICLRPPISHIVEPDSALAQQLSPKLARFRSAYPALKSMQETDHVR
jgi:xylulokinase